MNFWIHFYEFFSSGVCFFYSLDDCIEKVPMKNDEQQRGTNQQEHSNEMKSVLF